MKKNHFEFKSNELKKNKDYINQIFFDTTIYSVSSLSNPKDATLIFVEKATEDQIANLSKIRNSIIILNKSFFNTVITNNHIIYVDRPRKEYAKILNYILNLKRNAQFSLNSNNCYYKTQNIGENSIVEPFCLIDSSVQIGKNCIIKSGAKIRGDVVIGNDCIIKENCVIGADGFGVERDETGDTYKIPHVGGVLIGNNVEVGSCSVIAQGTIEPTVIEDYVKIDDSCFIAHNVHISKGSLIIANSEISGSVFIGKNSWISPNVCIKDGVNIGDNCTIGMGSVVLKDVEHNTTIIGNPGRPLKVKSGGK